MSLRILPFLFSVLLLLASCEKEYSVELGSQTPGTTGGTAKFNFAGGSGACTGAVVAGTFTSGTAVTTLNKVTLQVTVDSVGTYNISTSTVNGISFSVSGTFTVTGSQSITLTASGTPAADGSFNFKAGSNGCSFSVTIEKGNTQPPPPSGDCKSCSYVPICVGSWYTYEVNNNGTVLTLKEDFLAPEKDTTIDGKTYRKVNVKYDYGNGNVINNPGYYNCTDNVSTAIGYAVSNISGTTTIDVIKTVGLKANEPVSSTWTDLLTNQGGQTITMTYKIEEKNISHIVLGKTFTDVIHVSYTQTVDLQGTPVEAGSGDYYYAKNVGMIDNVAYSFGVEVGGFKIKDYYIP